MAGVASILASQAVDALKLEQEDDSTTGALMAQTTADSLADVE